MNNPHRPRAAQQERRTFRGRGGPTDGRLPPPKLPRRRHKYRTKEEAEEENAASDSSSSSTSRCVEVEVQQEDLNEHQIEETKDPSELRLDHLRQRIRNNRSAMSNSTAVAHLDHYQTHVLAATKNTLAEWKAVAPSIESSECRTSIKIELFGLVQQALQTGPLQGSQPGYFKRCGSAVAALAVDFLDEVLEEQDSTSQWWTERQEAALAQWRRNAERAVQADKEPSKSVQKKMIKRKKKRG